MLQLVEGGYIFLFFLFSILLFLRMRKYDKDLKSLVRLPGTGIFLLALFSFLTVFLSLKEYKDEGMVFINTYSVPVKGKKFITIGRGKDCDITVFNRFAEDRMVKMDLEKRRIFNISLFRNLMVNGKLYKSSDEKARKDGIPVNDGDYIKLGYALYRISFEKELFKLKNVIVPEVPSEVIAFYGGPVSPDRVNINKVHLTDTVSTTSPYIILVYASIAIAGGVAFFLFVLRRMSFPLSGEKRFITYPVLFVIFLFSFFYFASFPVLLTVSVLQFSHTVYEKGAFFSYLSFSVLLYLFFLSGVMFYKFLEIKSLRSLLLKVTVCSIVLMILLAISYFLHCLPLDFQSFRELIPGFALTLLVFGTLKLLNTRSEIVVFKTSQYDVNTKTLGYLYWFLVVICVAVIPVLKLSGILEEGRFITFMEFSKLLALSLMAVFTLRAFSWSKAVMPLLVLAFVVLTFIIYWIKDLGSLLQMVISTVLIISLFYFNNLFRLHRSVSVFLKAGSAVITVLVVLILVFLLPDKISTISDKLPNNVRITLWISPYNVDFQKEEELILSKRKDLSELAIRNGALSHIVRGIVLLRNAHWFPMDPVDEVYPINLPNTNTDYIFAVFVNNYGLLSLVFIFVTLVLFFIVIARGKDTYIVEQDGIRFFYSMNIVFASYLISYFLINVSAIYQLIPLTDVPVPFLTYARGMLLFFFLTIVFMVELNSILLRKRR